MKKIILTFCLIFFNVSIVFAVSLSDFLKGGVVGKQVGKWQASNLVPDNLMGRFFTLSSERHKGWQLRFFAFEDRNNILEKKNSFAEFVKKFGLEDLQSKIDAVPYNDGTLHSFTNKHVNDFLIAKGEDPLPEGIYFIISFREVMKK